ncbi:hypothetical protein GGI59_000734 [Rhizobium lentis]|uniref:Uncharacterized protein n=1 Tax=Rhizobium lentis TaxID=1138194 RepID=A0A7W8UKW2_9HYPH|nr:hypothetical protein [Rhizobium lentis]MBB5565371.1 hypothetical protein [Rhizobium lentis]
MRTFKTFGFVAGSDEFDPKRPLEENSAMSGAVPRSGALRLTSATTL